MIRTLLVGLLVLVAGASIAEVPAKSEGAKVPIRMTFDRLPVVDLISTYYSEIEKTSYVVSSEVYEVNDRVGIVFESSDAKSMRTLFLSVLHGAGLEVVKRDGVDFVRRMPAVPEVDMEVFIYRPRHRDISYFSDLVASIFKRGKFTFQRAVSASAAANAPASVSGVQSRPVDSGTSALSLQNKSFDVLVFNGPVDEIRKLESLLQQLDRPVGQVDIAAYVYEFSSSDGKETGLTAVAELLSGSAALKLNVGGSPPAANFLSFSISGASGALSIVARNLSTDGRFKVLSRPYVRVMSGLSARFSSGDEVPVLGMVQMDRSGNPVQSVEYKPSGVILDVAPTVRDEAIDLNIDQQLSNFVPTANGVNNSPTLIKRQVRTSLSARSGDVVVIGGLVSHRESQSSSRLFGFLPLGSSASDERAEVVVVLEVNRVGFGG